jgi:hypothetical protein
VARQTADALIRLAIDRGVPLFNDGQPEACAAVYEMTARSLVEFSYERLPEDCVDALRGGVFAASVESDAVERAWTLRHALDAALRILATTDRQMMATVVEDH